MLFYGTAAGGDVPAWVVPGSVAEWDASHNTLTVTGAASIESGPVGIAPVVVIDGPAASLTIEPGAGEPVVLDGLTVVNGASVTLESSSMADQSVVVIGGAGLNVDANSSLDITDSAVVFEDASLANVQALVAIGADGGLVSSSAEADASGLTAVGYASNAALGLTSFGGVDGLDADAVIVDTVRLNSDARSLAEPLLRCYETDQVELSTVPAAFATELPDRPVAPKYARFQTETSGMVTNLLHETVRLSDVERHVLRHLDGSADRNTLRDKLSDLIANGQLLVHDQNGVVTDPAKARELLGDPVNAALSQLVGRALIFAK